METLTIAEAAEATGLSKKALRNRVDRGQVRAVLRDGMRRIPRSELERAGIAIHGPGEARVEAAEGQEAAPGHPEPLGEVLDRLERQAGELAELRLLTREADSLREDRDGLEGALHEARAKVTELEAKLAAAERPRRWWQRRQAP